MNPTLQQPEGEFDAIASVVVADFDLSGSLLRGNAGLRRLAGGSLATLWQLIAHPAVDELLSTPAAGDGTLHRGLFTVRRHDRMEITVEGALVRRAGGLRLVAGYDMDQIDAMTSSLLALNDEMTDAYRALAASRRELALKSEQVERLSLTDGLTGVGNRRRLDGALAEESARASRYGQPLSLLLLDIDHFKRVNDSAGHAAGDVVLRTVGGLLLASLRQTDIATRMGGEEFAILLVATDLPEAIAVAERLRQAISVRDVGLAAPVTASFGVALLQLGEAGASLLERADRALYAAKAGGRNRVEMAPPGDRVSSQSPPIPAARAIRAEPADRRRPVAA